MGEHDPDLDGTLIMLTFSTISNDMTQDTYHQVAHRLAIRKVSSILFLISFKLL
jgi:hypothetical protein